MTAECPRCGVEITTLRVGKPGLYETDCGHVLSGREVRQHTTLDADGLREAERDPDVTEVAL